MVQELRRELATTLGDSFLRRAEARREHRFQVVDMNDRLLLAMTRPKRGFFRMRGRLVIDGPQGAPIGQIVHESFGSMRSAASAASAGLGMARRLPGAHHASIEGKLSSAASGLDNVGYARFGLEAGGQRLGSINAEDATKWDFNVQDPTGSEVARITKTWAGWTKERFTKADNYVVQMHRPLDEPLRSLVIASALAIDMELKQRGNQTRRTVGGTTRYK